MDGGHGPPAIVSGQEQGAAAEIGIDKSKPPRSWPNATEGVRLPVCEDLKEAFFVA